MASSSCPGGSMKSLIDAVAHVSGRLPCITAPISVKSSEPPGVACSGEGRCGLLRLRKRKHDAARVRDRDEKRAKRLEKNRLAALESRRRKKKIVEELQRSVQYYYRANATLKSQNADLERQLLIAKQKILEVEDEKNAKAKCSEGASVQGASIPKEVVTPLTVTPTAKLSKQPPSALQDTRRYSKLVATSPSMDEQAQKAQFAATQALYSSMGYPAGAARDAAHTFSQFVGLTGSVPAHATPRIGTPLLETTTLPAMMPVSVEPLKVQSSNAPYIQALNQFAMQQAPAAHVAVAASTAAFQAAQLHDQLNQNGHSSFSADIQALSAFSFSHPSSLPCVPIPDQNQPPAALEKNE